MSIISSKNVNEIIRKTLSMINKDIINHGEVTGYILYKMLEYEHIYSEQELVDYTMLGILHDMGLYKESNVKNLINFEVKNPWPHSVYGFLFLKYLSPMDDKAEVVLYHHLDYYLYSKIQSKYMHVAEYLNLADKMHAYMLADNATKEKDYFVKYKNIRFSGQALDLFLKAEAKYKITEKMANGSYKTELNELLSKKTFSEKYKKGFLEMLVYSIDFRSEHTVVHTMSTVNFAKQLGKLLKLNPADQEALYYGALLHDIGKIAIPIEILEAPGRLTPEEMRIMKAHVRITEMILEGVVDQKVVDIAARHHEKLDGTGYHKGLKEEDLTMPQQIVAVADILSALYGKRSYKEAFDSNKIISIMTEDANNHKIGKKVVDCMLHNYDKIISNYEKEKETTVGMYLNIKEQYQIIIKRFEQFDKNE